MSLTLILSFSKPDLTPEDYVGIVTHTFMREADPTKAEQQMAYMRGQFEYCGLGANKWYPMAKEIFAEHGIYSGSPLKKFIAACYDQPYREIQYVGIEMMQRSLRDQKSDWIKTLEKCMVTNSWWDTVDWLSKLVGMHFQTFSELQHPYAEKWISSDNIWLQRAAIIHQLFYKDKTDEELLFDLVRRQADSKEFFIRKACGWALRQYSKINPKAVKNFVEKNTLSNLTVKEALRLMR